jgi:peptide/nickel transport system permease protein
VTSLAFARAPIQTFRQMSSAVGIVTRRPLGAVGLAIVVLFVFLGLFGPWLAPYDPNVINVRARLESPSWLHWLGTDQLGRDTLSRLLVGTRVAFLVAFISIAITAAIGVSAGLASGLGPRWLDRILVTIFDTVRSFPMPIYARITRTQTMAIKSSEFILAERSIGVGSLRIAVMHIFPNIAGQILVLMSMDVPVVIMVESGLSFLGLGIRPPNASWGTILNDGYAFIRDTSWPVLAGGVPLILATIGFTFLGETLRDLLDPKLRRSF